MARPPKSAQYLPSPNNDEIVIDTYDTFEVRDDETQTTQKKKFEDILSDMNDDSDNSELRVYRQTGGGKSPMRLLEVLPVDKYSYSQLLMYIKNTYGGGDFRIHLRSNGALVANKLETIEAPINDGKRSHISESGDIIHTVLSEMQRSNERFLELLYSKSHNDDDQEEKVLSKMMKYKELFGGGNTQQSSGGLGQIKETLELLALLGLNFGGASEKETGFMDILEKSLPVVLNGMSQPRNLPQPQPQMQPQYKPNPIQPEDDPMLKEIMIKNGLNQLLVAAQKNSDPGMYAQLVLDQFGEQRVLEFFSDPAQIDKIIKTNPKLHEHIEWFELLIEHIKALMGQESKVSDQYDDDLTDESDNDTTGESDHETEE